MSTFSTSDWRRAAAIFEAAIDLPASQRQGLIRRACGPDDRLRRAVETLLANDDTPSRPATNSAASPLPARIGSYRLLEPLGHGGMNRVFLGEKIGGVAGAPVAIKLIDARHSAQEGRLFDRECRILARLQHPGIARFLDGGATPDGNRFLVMERIEGAPLLEHCDARQLGVADRLRIFLDICEAVGHAHTNLVVHRDLKPQNVLVTDEGNPKLLDFGIAKFLGADGIETTELCGRFQTPAYASPEQLSGAPVGTATDIYSLGLLLFELLVGRPPFTAQDLLRNGAFEARRRGPGTPSRALRSATKADAKARGTTLERLGRKLRGDLNTIVERCLQLDPGHRYSSVERLAADVKRHLDGRPIRARRAHLGYRIATVLRRNPLAVAAATTATVALAATLFAMVSSHRSVVRARNRANPPIGP